MSDREDILQAVRRVFKTGLGLTDTQVVVEDTKSARVPLPYLTVKVIAYGGNGVAQDWVTNTVNGSSNPEKTPRGYRETTISVNAYGTGAAAWLEALPDLISEDDIVRAELTAAGLTLSAPSAITDISTLLDTAIEYRANVTFFGAYERTGTPIEQVELDLIDLTVDFTSPNGAPSIIMTETVDPLNPPC